MEDRYLYVSCSGSNTSVGEEKARLSAIVYLLLCGFCSERFPLPLGTLDGLWHSLTLRLDYVPGDHGSHGRPKRNASCDLVSFWLGTQVLLGIITFSHGLSRYPLQPMG